MEYSIDDYIYTEAAHLCDLDRESLALVDDCIMPSNEDYDNDQSLWED